MNCTKCNDELILGTNWTNYYYNRNTRFCSKCSFEKSTKWAENNPERVENNRNKRNKNRRLERMALKFQTLDAYDAKCKKCGETEKLFLVLDHINDVGSWEDKELKNELKSISFHEFLKERGFPGKDTWLQVLCHSCNAVKELKERSNKTINLSKIDLLNDIYTKINYTPKKSWEEYVKEAELLISKLENFKKNKQ